MPEVKPLHQSPPAPVAPQHHDTDISTNLDLGLLIAAEAAKAAAVLQSPPPPPPPPATIDRASGGTKSFQICCRSV